MTITSPRLAQGRLLITELEATGKFSNYISGQKARQKKKKPQLKDFLTVVKGQEHESKFTSLTLSSCGQDLVGHSRVGMKAGNSRLQAGRADVKTPLIGGDQEDILKLYIFIGI